MFLNPITYYQIQLKVDKDNNMVWIDENKWNELNQNNLWIFIGEKEIEVDWTYQS